MGQQI